jgi:mannosyltransferase OCH1-like enzyme
MNLPKIIHQIWIGNKKRPDIWMDGIKRFAETYGYEYRLWDDEAVSKLTLINRSWYDKEPTYNGKSDILRYELLDQFGGIYIDADMAIVRPDGLHSLINGFVDRDCGFGFEVDNQLICGAVFLAVKGSKFVKKCIEEIPLRDMSQLAWLSIGPKLITDLVIRHQKDFVMNLYKSTVFYPLRWHGIQDVQLHTKMVLPDETVLFQYGYSTNNLEAKI